MKTRNQQLGSAGEDAAARYLAAGGHRILDRNWRCRLGELDLVTEHQGQLVAVEVKTRTCDAFGTAFEAITAAKYQRLQRLALQWCREHRRHPGQLRVDVLCLYPEPPGWRIEHHRRVTS